MCALTRSKQLISTLSGGNQQKIILGRALVSEARILLLNEPTRGVDVGTKVEIHELIRRPRARGPCGHRQLIRRARTRPGQRPLPGPERGRIWPRRSQGASLTEDNILACAVTHATGSREVTVPQAPARHGHGQGRRGLDSALRFFQVFENLGVLVDHRHRRGARHCRHPGLPSPTTSRAYWSQRPSWPCPLWA